MKIERIQEIYVELGAMSVSLDQTPELGLDYFKDRMFDCRRLSDTLTERIIEVNRELSGVRRSLRAAGEAKEIARDSAQMISLRDTVRELAGRAEDLKYLEIALKVKQGNLKQIGSDIRLIVGIVEYGLKYGGGEVPGGDRPAAPDKIRTVKPRANRAVVEAPEPAVTPIREVAPLAAAPVATEADAFDIAAFLDS